MIFITKECTKCGDIKLIDSFGIQKGGKNGLRSICKRCVSESAKQWRSVPENAKKVLALKKRWRADSAQQIREYNKQWRKDHLDRCRELVKVWAKSHPEKVRRFRSLAYKKRISTPRGKLENSIRCGLYQSLRGNKGGRRWESLVGYSVNELMEHIEKQFQPGMTWKNYGKYGWHIDHKIPKVAFNFEKASDSDFCRCWGLHNLRPLWSVENWSKNAKVERPFQPSLLI